MNLSLSKSCVETTPAKLKKEYGVVDLGRWTNYLLSLPTDFVNDWIKTEQHLEDYNVLIEETDSFILKRPSSRSNALDRLDNIAAQSTLALLESQTLHLPFEVRYQLEACISQGLLNEYSMDDKFLQKLNSFGSERARMMLEGVADRNFIFYNPMDMFEEPQVMHYWPGIRVPSQTALIRKAIITPTMIYFKTPTVEVTNRILRQYSHLTDRFLRVQFTDELTFGKISSSQGFHRSDELYARVERVLRNGIKVGDRVYKILAWSNSQFREHGALFFCPTDHVTCEGIRDLVGDLKHIRSVGKYAARMGQCLTTTRHVNGISVPRVVAIDDIKYQKDGREWTFTDGVGKISLFNARMISNDHNLAEVPSCVQFRMGGCKGILVVWSDVPAHEVHMRPSQQKFSAVYNGLEIIKVSKYAQATLNSQTIPLLHCLGVSGQVFMDLLEEELKEYEEAMHSSAQAARLLQERIDENQITLVIAEMVNVFMETHEPFLWSLIRLWRCWALQRLKYKAAISVKKSAFVYGCVDETGLLRGYSEMHRVSGLKDENKLPQVFLQIPEQGNEFSTTKYKIITGLCVLGRNPSLHPGDIQIVQAVDVPELRHLRNVVVFPQNGDRDLPSMCSGGDLDGDDFFVFWDERLLPSEWNYPPMDHDAETGTSVARQSSDVTIEDMCDFFTDYMKHDSLGVIATSHKAWADKVGPKDSRCLELAALHSAAVDYVKSGKPAVMHRSLFPDRYPHFMCRQKSYKSFQPLGLIYERVNVETFSPAYEMAFDERILSHFDLLDEELTKARFVKSEYDIAMRRLMGQHEKAITEYEIWSTFVLSKPRVGNDYKLQEAVGRDISALKDRFRKVCAEAITGMPQTSSMFSYSGIQHEKLERFVAAMYTVTYQEVQAALEARDTTYLDAEGNKVAKDQHPSVAMPLISFPWLFHRELIRIATGKREFKQDRTSLSGVSRTLHEAQTSRPSSDVGGADLNINKLDTTAVVEDLLVFEEGDGDCTHIASGKVVHRGDILDLFEDHAADKSDAMNLWESTPETGDFSQKTVKTILAQNSEDFNSGIIAQPKPEEGEDIEHKEVEFEEIEMIDDEGEDALEVLASKIAVTAVGSDGATSESLIQ
ncbi:RNA dependent RNA polymerase-domain-containing protein [Coniella lustricola]|uniref:RNA-dependent RNA polymerase n=1 Tax=Coniella lustricola TaxID=2025994 RepID=A0A2T3A8J0_9PEZI|nr:RNA dependent RNA polymerase-domain-containing protein [Coniella lustricola]